MPSSPAEILIVRPRSTGNQQGGDEVMYRKILPYLAEQWSTEVLELEPVGTFQKYFNLLTITPPECTRFLSESNRRRLAKALAAKDYAAVVLINEVTFPMLPVAKDAGVPAVLISQNVHSLVAETDPGRLANAMRPIALAFERRFYADPAVKLVCISRQDVQALTRGTGRTDITHSPPGPPPPSPLAADAPVLGEAVITGSYDWWRKRRDLTTFAQGGALGAPIYANDPQALAVLGTNAAALVETADFWSQGLRFGLITDKFLGGFKLKSLEYIAKNCVVISMSDISLEFAGLPHAEEFVRLAHNNQEAAAIIRDMTAEDPKALIARFTIFKDACLSQFAWTKSLAVVGDTIRASIQ